MASPVSCANPMPKSGVVETGPSSTGEEGSGIFTSKASTEPSGKVVRSTASETIELSGDPMLPTGPDVMLPEEVSGPLRKKM